MTTPNERLTAVSQLCEAEIIYYLVAQQPNGLETPINNKS